MADIPLKAAVSCTDGACGTSTAVIIDPVQQAVTHVVVQTDKYDDHLVPLENIAATDHDSITLNISKAQLANLPHFKEMRYVQGVPEYPTFTGGEWEAPYVTALPLESAPMMTVEAVPPGELAVHRGDKVHATDATVGEVGEFVIDAASGHISHLVLQKGHLWGKREVTLGLDLVDHVEEGEVYLNVDKDTIDQLPAVKVKRHYRWQKDE